MSNKKSHKSNIYVPCPDVLFCIFIRLPIKSLLRFRSVAILWNDAISDGGFKKAQCDQSKAFGRVNFLFQKCYTNPQWYYSDKFKLINSENHRVISIEEQRFPLNGYEFAHVLCSHNGLVLLKKFRAYKTFVLWNPSTRQCLKLEPCPYLDAYTLPYACGLSYDSTTDDYKVILIYKSFYLVYSSRNSWKLEKTTLPMLEQYFNSNFTRATNDSCSQGITIEGCVYWSMTYGRHQYVKKDSTITYFDVKSDELKELPTPNFIGEKELFCLTTLKGRLCLYGGKLNSYTYWSDYESELDMWIMEEDGWKLLMKLPRVSSEFCRYNFLLCCTENGEIIFEGPHSCHISIYNPKEQKIIIRNFVSEFYKRPIGYEYVIPYLTGLDSLYFPKVMHKRKQSNMKLKSRHHRLLKQ